MTHAIEKIILRSPFTIIITLFFILTTFLFAGHADEILKIKTAQAQRWADIHWGKGHSIDKGQIYYGTNGYPAAIVFTVFRQSNLSKEPTSILQRVEQARALRDAAEQRYIESLDTGESEKAATAFAEIDAAFAAMRYDDDYGTIVMNVDPNDITPLVFYDGLPPHYVALEDYEGFCPRKAWRRQGHG